MSATKEINYSLSQLQLPEGISSVWNETEQEKINKAFQLAKHIDALCNRCVTNLVSNGNFQYYLPPLVKDSLANYFYVIPTDKELVYEKITPAIENIIKANEILDRPYDTLSFSDLLKMKKEVKPLIKNIDHSESFQSLQVSVKAFKFIIHFKRKSKDELVATNDRNRLMRLNNPFAITNSVDVLGMAYTSEIIGINQDIRAAEEDLSSLSRKFFSANYKKIKQIGKTNPGPIMETILRINKALINKNTGKRSEGCRKESSRFSQEAVKKANAQRKKYLRASDNKRMKMALSILKDLQRDNHHGKMPGFDLPIAIKMHILCTAAIHDQAVAEEAKKWMGSLTKKVLSYK